MTQNITLMPPPFSDGLDVWSRQNGGPGSATYDSSNNAQVLFTDPDFEECLEIVTNTSPQKLRYTGQTPLTPGCYLRVSARVKVVSGIMPDFEIAAWPGDSAGNYVGGLVEKGPRVAATEYDKVYDISAVFGSGDRPGVDCVWGLTPVYGHFGLNVVGGANGSSVRIESIRIEDVTSAYLRVMMDWVDVRDFGARGDGVFNNKNAFQAADAAANGRQVLVPAGDYFVGSDVTLSSRFRFEGRILMDQGDQLNLVGGLRYSSYLDAFKDERLALEKALQTLINFNDHDSLDLEGRVINLDAPLDVQAAVANRTSFTTRRAIRNGKIAANSGGDWSAQSFTRNADYVSGETVLTGVNNAGAIPRGSLITGAGVGREIYVTDTDAATSTITISKPLFAAAANQSYTFTRFAYLLDFTGFNFLSNFELNAVELDGAGIASCLALPIDGFALRLTDCWFTEPKDRGVTSCGNGDFALTVERCEFASSEQNVANSNRSSIAINCNSNDVRVRHNRGARFRHFCVMGGTNLMVHSNHVYQGLEGTTSRLAGFVFTEAVINSTVTGNYIDNCFIEWTNEHAKVINTSNIFGNLTIDGNLFFASNVLSGFNFIRIKPFANNTGLRDLAITDNTFRVTGGAINRVEAINSGEGNLNQNEFENIVVSGNAFDGVNSPILNPCRVNVTRSSGNAAANWLAASNGQLPFGGKARSIESIVATSEIKNTSGGQITGSPWVDPEQGANGDDVRVRWPQAAHGSVTVRFRCDAPG